MSSLNDRYHEIGGYFGFELGKQKNIIHQTYNPYFFNSARSAFFVLLKSLKIKSILIPKFICNSMIQPLQMLNIEIKYYDLNDDFYPKINETKDFLLYINYFGICTQNQVRLLNEYPKDKLIFDDSQALFVSPCDDIHTIYSPRKFLPISDGGMLITKVDIESDEINSLDFAMLQNQYNHLYQRLICGAKSGYIDFQQSERRFEDFIPSMISPITKQLLSVFNYKEIQKQRVDNFKTLHQLLGGFNKLSIDEYWIESPLTYPFLCDSEKAPQIKSMLISNNVYTPTYWQECMSRVDKQGVEKEFVNDIVHFICDQRYGADEMIHQYKLISSLLSE